jgi:hypothetical protein
VVTAIILIPTAVHTSASTFRVTINAFATGHQASVVVLASLLQGISILTETVTIIETVPTSRRIISVTAVCRLYLTLQDAFV